MRLHKSLCALFLLIALSLVAIAQSNQLTTATAPAPIKIGSLTFSGNLRARFESWDWFATDAAQNEYNFGAATLRLSLGQQKENLEWQVEGAFPLLLNLPTKSIAPAPQGQLGLGAAYFAANGNQDASAFIKQAYVRFKGKANSVKLGRFEFSDGLETTPTDASLATLKRDHISQRLIGPFGFTHVGRSFDGVQYVYNTKQNNFTFVAVRPTAGVFQLRGWNQLDVDFYYGAYSKPIKAKSSESDLRVFMVHYHDGRRVPKTDNRSLALRTADIEKIRVTTVGGHYVTVAKVGVGKADFLLWGTGQFGDWGRLSHRAGAVAIEAGYQFNSKLKPWLRAGYFRSTGDGDATDTKHGTFFQMLPTPRIYASFPFFNAMNNEDAFVQLRLKPHAKLGVRADVHHLRLSNTNDLWFLGGGAFQRQTFGFIGRPGNGKQLLGTLGDVSLDWTITPMTAMTFYLAGVRGGEVPAGIYPSGRNARFTYIELTKRF